MRTIAIYLSSTTAMLLAIITIQYGDLFRQSLIVAGQLLMLLAYVVIGSLVLAALVLAAAVWQTHVRKPHSNGAVPVKKIQMASLVGRWKCFWAGVVSPQILYDRSKDPSPALAIGPGGVFSIELAAPTVEQLQFASLAEKTRQLQVLVADSNFGRNPVSAPVARMLSGGYDKTPRPALTVSQETPERAPAAAPLQLEAALDRSKTAGKWIMGFSQTENRVCAYDPDVDLGIAVAGGSGTGKTMCTGYLLVLHALRAGWHVALLDGKGGMDFSWLAPWIEYHVAEPESITDQLAAVVAEHRRRQALLLDAGASTLADAPKVAKRTLVLIEEFGTTLEMLQSIDRASYKQAVGHVKTLARVSRASGMHFGILDQDATLWPGVLMSACRRRLAYQVDISAASTLKEYGADQLEGKGKFMNRGHVFDSWHVKPVMREQMAKLPRLNGYRVIEGQATPVTPDPVPTAVTAAPARRTWRDFVEEYLQTHQELLQGEGIEQLARAMSAYKNDGDDSKYRNYKSTASDTVAKIRAERGIR